MVFSLLLNLCRFPFIPGFLSPFEFLSKVTCLRLMSVSLIVPFHQQIKIRHEHHKQLQMQVLVYLLLFLCLVILQSTIVYLIKQQLPPFLCFYFVSVYCSIEHASRGLSKQLKALLEGLKQIVVYSAFFSIVVFARSATSGHAQTFLLQSQSILNLFY